MPKKIAQDIARQVRELGEEVIKEGARQPVELIETAAKQIGILPKGWGEESGVQLSPQVIQEKRQKEEKELEFWRRRKRELEVRGKPTEIISEKESEERKLAEEKKRESLPKVPGKKPRGLPLGVKRGIEKSRAELVGRRIGG